MIVAMAPVRARPALTALAAFDALLADLARRADAAEIILAQLRLAWWRDEIAAIDIVRARPDPLLAQLAEMRSELPAPLLLALVDAWEHMLLAEPFDLAAARRFAQGRGNAFFALASCALTGDESGAPPSGEAWGLCDLALNLADAALAERLFAATCDLPAPGKAARPLYALDHWARRVAARRGARIAWREQAAILRIGLFGR
ncbi:MAG: hypothetical protein GW859_03260 [Sphingomonadales bacterium]|nr:hypothetical protein [Sphingomonadales bacterium]